MDRIEHREPVVGAWTYLDPEQAIAAARKADRATARGPLHGVPVAVKDIFDTVDMPTELGTPVYAGRRPAWDAACVARVRAAGAIVLGKTVTTEFAYFSPGKTCNPYSPAHTPGGSSSGSAAAVADGMVPIGFGSQTAASVTRPASYCGVLGYKASFAAVSLAGVKELARSLDCLGLLSRAIDDLALVRSVLIGGTGEDAFVPIAAAPRIGVCAPSSWERAGGEQIQAMTDVVRHWRDRRADIVDIEFTGIDAELVEAHKTVMAFEAAQSLAYEWSTQREALSTPLTELLALGLKVSYTKYSSALKLARQTRARIDSLFDHVDVLFAPSAPGEAPLRESGTGDPLFSRVWALLGLPSLSFPIGYGSCGLPLGGQLIGRINSDDSLLATAQWAIDQLDACQRILRGTCA